MDVYTAEYLRILDECIEHKNVEYFINGYMDNFGLRDPEYTVQMNPDGCLRVIYDKYINDPGSGIDKKFHDAILNDFKILNGKSDFLHNVVMVWVSHMMCSMQKTAPFEIESDDLRQALRDNLERNMEMYKSPLSSIDNRPCYYDTIIEDSNYYSERYGINIL